MFCRSNSISLVLLAFFAMSGIGRGQESTESEVEVDSATVAPVFEHLEELDPGVYESKADSASAVLWILLWQVAILSLTCVLGVLIGMLAWRKGYSFWAWFASGGLLGVSAIALCFLPFASCESIDQRRQQLIKSGNRIGTAISIATVVLYFLSLTAGILWSGVSIELRSPFDATASDDVSLKIPFLVRDAALVAASTLAAMACVICYPNRWKKVWPFVVAIMMLGGDPLSDLFVFHLLHVDHVDPQLQNWSFVSISSFATITALVFFGVGMAINIRPMSQLPHSVHTGDE